MIKVEHLTTAAVLIGGLYLFMVVLAILAFYFFRRDQKIQDERVQRAENAAHRSEIKASNADDKANQMKDMFDFALQIERMKGKVETLTTLHKAFAGSLVKQSKDHALGEVRKEMQGAIRGELEALGLRPGAGQNTVNHPAFDPRLTRPFPPMQPRRPRPQGDRPMWYAESPQQGPPASEIFRPEYLDGAGTKTPPPRQKVAPENPPPPEKGGDDERNT